jgi:hypothetical protein
MDAALEHARCLINFVAGNYAGTRSAKDIQAKDFLGVDWWPRDEDFHRKLRGRVQFINERLANLSWERVVKHGPVHGVGHAAGPGDPLGDAPLRRRTD